jgi:hypothetical protein
LVVELRTEREEPASYLAFDPHGRYLTYNDAGGVIRRYFLDVNTLIELARDRLTRQMTDDECSRYLQPSGCS